MNIKKKIKNWYLIDCNNLILGRISTIVANILMGKNKITYSYNNDEGDFVILINTDKVILTGNKENHKKYWKHTGYIGSIKFLTPKSIRNKNSCNLLINSIKGMLPKNKLKNRMLKRLKCYKTSLHPHNSQKPIIFNYKNYLYK